MAVVSFLLLIVNTAADNLEMESDWLHALTLSKSGTGNVYKDTTIDIGADAFNTAFQDNPFHTLRLELDCDTCASYKQLTYYRRLTDTGTFDPYGYMANWASANNVINVNFALYSTFEDVMTDQNRWTYCDYDYGGVGAFHNCGPSGAIIVQFVGSNSNAKPGRISIYTATRLSMCTFTAFADARLTMSVCTQTRLAVL